MFSYLATAAHLQLQSCWPWSEGALVWIGESGREGVCIILCVCCVYVGCWEEDGERAGRESERWSLTRRWGELVDDCLLPVYPDWRKPCGQCYIFILFRHIHSWDTSGTAWRIKQEKKTKGGGDEEVWESGEAELFKLKHRHAAVPRNPSSKRWTASQSPCLWLAR